MMIKNAKEAISSLWIVVTLFILIADIMGFLGPGSLEEIMSGTVDGIEFTEEFLLLASLPMAIPILMVFFSKFLKDELSRKANLIASVLTIAYVWGGMSFYLPYYFFATLETICLIAIFRMAWQMQGGKK